MTTTTNEKKKNRHTRKWFIANFGADPLKLNLPYVKVRNPYYSRAPPMKLWTEEQVLPFRSEEKISQHKIRSERMLQVWAKIKEEEQEAHRVIKEMKAQVPLNEEESKQIERLRAKCDVISSEISELHDEKVEVYDEPFLADEITEEQDSLREERWEIYGEINKIFAVAKNRYLASLPEEQRKKTEEAYEKLAKFYKRRGR